MHAEIPKLLGQVAGGGNLSLEDTSSAFDSIMRGEWSDAQVGLLLTSLAAKGETVDEIAGAALALRRHMTPIRSRYTELLDTCGTGGGGSTLFNVSTTAAIVAAAAGVPVAKHGNRSITSRSGSADVLAELGVNINATVPQVEACLNELGICFCFAPLAHPAMKNVAAVRKQLGIRTIFNIIGPLVNPARATHQLLGAGRPELRPLLAGAMARLGTKRTLVVSGDDGLGDVTLTGITNVTSVTSDVNAPIPDSDPTFRATAATREFSWTPADFGIETQSLEGLSVQSPAESAAIVRQVLEGVEGPARDLVLLNAAAALIAFGKSTEPRDAAAQCAAAIDRGDAKNLLAQLVNKSHQLT